MKNVWAPTGATPASKLPIMVFVHGGSFIVGSGGAAVPVFPYDSSTYDGCALAGRFNMVRSAP